MRIPRPGVRKMAVFLGKAEGRAPFTQIDADIATIAGTTDRILRAADRPTLRIRETASFAFGVQSTRPSWNASMSRHLQNEPSRVPLGYRQRLRL